MYAIFFILFAFFLIIIAIKNKNSSHNLTQADVENRLAQMISDNFQEAGWNDWDSRLHLNKEQLKRLERAVKSKDMTVLEYDENTGIAKVSGDTNKIYRVSGKGCNCADFEHRYLPCKHMYFLAIMLSEQKEKDRW